MRKNSICIRGLKENAEGLHLLPRLKDLLVSCAAFDQEFIVEINSDLGLERKI